MTNKPKFWLPKNRYCELKYHTLQYKYWKRLLEKDDISEETSARCKINIYNVERAVEAVNCDFKDVLLIAVTDGLPYSKLSETLKMPSKEEFDSAYRKFFYFLGKFKGI